MSSFTPHIYMITNLINRKIYIGQTNGKDRYYFGGGVFIRKAIKKYGRQSFEKQILIEGEFSVKELNLWEKFYIDLFDSRNSLVGYNMKEGGWNASFQHSQDALQKISNRSRMPDNTERIRRIQKEAARMRIGTHHKKESKVKNNTTKFGNRIIEIYKNEELVHTCDLQSEVVEFIGAKKSAVSNALAGISNTCKGFKLKYKEVCHR